ncbi:MAG TPA: serine hydrolase, partial [Firmicutes bacterium]|nr:serine hydrolase [Bacillota bacterium]
MLPERRILKILGRLEGEVGLYLEDVNSGELFTVNPERAFPAASTI